MRKTTILILMVLAITGQYQTVAAQEREPRGSEDPALQRIRALEEQLSFS
ncbi:MAG: hypothetical protein ACKOB4_19800 [Acidobacteriota bacterium]